jgi:transposase
LLIAQGTHVPIGVVGQMRDGGPALLARIPGIETTTFGNTPPGRLSFVDRRAWGPGGAGVIEIDLPDGARVWVDAFVDARALARVLSALKRLA